jgi:hypothetical protein
VRCREVHHIEAAGPSIESWKANICLVHCHKAKHPISGPVVEGIAPVVFGIRGYSKIRSVVLHDSYVVYCSVLWCICNIHDASEAASTTVSRWFVIIFIICFIMFFFIFSWGWGWVHLVLRPLFCLLYQPLMIDDDDDCGAIGGKRIGRENRSTWRKLASVPLCPPQIPHDLIRARTWAAEVGSQRLTAWAMTRPFLYVTRSCNWSWKNMIWGCRLDSSASGYIPMVRFCEYFNDSSGWI